ncbi:MAG: UDP-glucose 4-epimerase GalE [Parachlamydia sp.]|jgi:UDP-glucose 4-epimerase|nr:UDP-glucose 4-epimerase GalE [Parachlamydia sp.]
MHLINEVNKIMPNETILVTGGAGFIGSHVNKMLRQAAYRTIVLDNLSRGSSETVIQGTFVQGNINDAALLETLFTQNKIDAVMHFAAFIDVGESVKDPALYYQNNVINTLNLLNAMVKFNVKKIVFSSTAALYGMPSGPCIKEEDPCHPINPYGESKWIVEKILRDYQTAYGLSYSALRYFNAAGGDPDGLIKNHQKISTNLIPIILKSLKSGTAVTIYGTDYPTPDGTCIRDYIHIEDLGQAHLLALQALLRDAPSTVYNLGNGQGFSVKEVIQAVEKVLNQKVKVIEGHRRAGDPPILLADSSKALKELGWTPRFNLHNIIQHAWMALN